MYSVLFSRLLGFLGLIIRSTDRVCNVQCCRDTAAAVRTASTLTLLQSVKSSSRERTFDCAATCPAVSSSRSTGLWMTARWPTPVAATRTAATCVYCPSTGLWTPGRSAVWLSTCPPGLPCAADRPSLPSTVSYTLYFAGPGFEGPAESHRKF